MKLRKIARTSTIAWSPGQHIPLLATGTVAGALDASFSTTTELEIWDLDLANTTSGSMKRLAVAKGHVRFNRLAWGPAPTDASKPRGIIAGGMEDGQLDLWSPDILLANAAAGTTIPSPDSPDPLILRKAAHSGPVRGLDFNPSQANLLASAATEGEIFVWDLTNPALPYSPGNRSQRLEDITALSWNRHAAHILATSSNNGYTVVWDLRNKREVTQLRHLGSGPGGRVPVSGVAWNPDVATQLVTAGDDDISPVILIWDLRNSRAPEKQLTGHSKGILSVSWCPRDSDLLMSSAKDNRTLVWNPSTGDVIGELEQSSNWAFDLQWCTRNPDLVGVASFDGQVVVHSLQGTSTGLEESQSKPSSPTTADPFSPAYQMSTSHSSDAKFQLVQPPKWMRRPVGATWAFGGRLVTFSRSHITPQPVNTGERRPVPISIRTVPTDPEFAHRLDELNKLMGDSSKEECVAFCETRSTDASKDTEVWKFLRLMFEGDARERALEYLGFDRKDVGGAAFQELLKKLNISSTEENGEHGDELAPPPTSSKLSKSSPLSIPPVNAEDSSAKDTNGVSGLFGGMSGDDGLGIQSQEGSGMGSTSAVPASPFKLYASTVSSRNEDIDVDSLISRAIILGNYSVAVQACMAVNRYADAMVLAVCGGPDLIAKARDEYFAKTRDSKSYVRILQGVASSDLKDVVENAELGDTSKDSGWRDILALICMYAKPEEFATLFGILGNRLEGIYSYPTTKDASAPSFIPKKVSDQVVKERASAAVLCYLSAGNLNRLVEIWASRMSEEEREVLSQPNASRHNSHVTALQSFIEKVTLYRRAASFVDSEFTSQPTIFKLSVLYEYYADFAEQASAQGRMNLAWSFLSLIPEAFKWVIKYKSGEVDPLELLRDRLYRSGGLSSALQAQDPKVPYVFDDVTGRAMEYETIQTYESSGYTQEQAGYVNGIPGQAQQQQQQVYQNTQYPTAAPVYGTPTYIAPGYSQQPVIQQQTQQQQQYGNQQQQQQYANQWQQPQQQQPVSKPGYYGQQPQPSAPQTQQYGYQAPVAASMVNPPPTASGSNYQQTPLPPSTQKIAPASGFNDLPAGLLSSESRRPTPKPIGTFTPGFGQQQQQAAAQQQAAWNAAPPMGGSQQPSMNNSTPISHGMMNNQNNPPPTMMPPPTMAPTMGQQWTQQQQQVQQQQAGPPPSISKPPTPAPIPPPPTGGYAGQQQQPPPMPAPFRRPTPPIVAPPPQMSGQPPQQYYQPTPTQQPGGSMQHPPQVMGMQGRPPAPHQMMPPTGQPPMTTPPPPSNAQQAEAIGQGLSRPPSVGGSVGAGQGPAPSSTVNSPALPRTAPGPQASGAAPSNRLPPGDRSKIPPHHMPIVNVLSRVLILMKQLPGTHGKRVAEDTEKRLNTLFDQLNNADLKSDLTEKLVALVQAVEARDFTASREIHGDILARTTSATGLDLSWVPAIKRLVERAAESQLQATQQRQQQQQQGIPQQNTTPPMQSGQTWQGGPPPQPPQVFGPR
ncbi:hypothetical protein SmJEL517_g02007 [Synchytrium microbalum]|uniref:Protein transport protein SEC31 n=1 Tax=Synchytrium microbalum TaxID=1806994 RepID=A0A507CDW7_9FUNG|nr:uncharacterized protein SmJEL517_g02007 [Synchytrium microbalum]TPX35765.1 hypothetical protein SmJEL517_g02007 [Synchytrium microbalum]